MAGTRDYPLAGVLGAGNLIHHARLVGLLGKRIETRCGLEGDKTDRDGGIWCPDCLALERSKTGTHDERDGDEAAVLLAIRRRALTASTYAEWHQVGRDSEALIEQLAAATARVGKAERQRDVARARLAELGETREEWGVRVDGCTDTIGVYPGRESAEENLALWRKVWPSSEFTLMQRENRAAVVSGWREVPDA